MSTPGHSTGSISAFRSAVAVADGKFLRVRGERLLVKGVSYGTFAPGTDGSQFPPAERIADDFAQMARFGINTVRTYTPPPPTLLDEAAKHSLHVMAGLPWAQHVAFLDDRSFSRQIRSEMVASVRALSRHSAVLAGAIGSEIPPGVVRWHGRKRVERFLRELYDEAKNVAPEMLFTYVNYPPTEQLELPFLDVCAFNIYLHNEPELRAYLTRLHHIAGSKPLLIAEVGANSLHHGEEGQAASVAMQVRTTLAAGACGVVVFAWTDEWWRGGYAIEDWKFGLVDTARRPKLAAHTVSRVFNAAPFREEQRRAWPKVSVVVCAHNAAGTLDDCLSSLARLRYPRYEVIVVSDGSTDETGTIARRYPGVNVIDTPNGGLAAARNIGLGLATGEIVAYTDADVRVDQDWLTYLVQPFVTSEIAAAGGPNVVPRDDPWMAQCIARAPGAPTHVMLDDRIAEHVPGCNMAFRREALIAIEGFNPIYLRAGDDVDVCWRLQARGWKIGFAPAALVWHHHRATTKAYWMQQVGYGEGETWLMPHHPDKFIGRHITWVGRVYSPLPFIRGLSDVRVNAGVWGTALFPSVYRTDGHQFAYMPHSGRWQAASLLMIAIGGGLIASPFSAIGVAFMVLGLIGLTVTVTKCVTYARRSEIGSLPPIDHLSRRVSRLLYRTAIAWLHFVQPFARAQGRLRGMLWSPPLDLRLEPSPPRRRAVSWSGLWSGARLMLGREMREQFWSESWLSGPDVLSAITNRLRRSRAVRGLEIDDGWWTDRDVSLAVGRFAWLDVRGLVEDHGAGRCLLRICARLRPTAFGLAEVGSLCAAVVYAVIAGVPTPWLTAGGVAGALVVGDMALQIGAVTVALREVVAQTAANCGMLALNPIPLSQHSERRPKVAALDVTATSTADEGPRPAYRPVRTR